MSAPIDYLSQFSAGQGNVLDFGAVDGLIAQMRNPLQCRVKDDLQWGVPRDTVVTLHATGNHNLSSEHLVIHCSMAYPTGKKVSVVVKFHIALGDVTGRRVMSMTTDHCKEIIENYNRLHRYITDAGMVAEVIIVPVCIVTSGAVNLWVEKDVINFTKFVKPVAEHARMIACTNYPVLRKLQQKIFELSRQRHTICDLQGAVMNNGMFCLCDVEFTDTVGKFGHSSTVLLAHYIADREEEEKARLVEQQRRHAEVQEQLQRARQRQRDSDLLVGISLTSAVAVFAALLLGRR